MSLLRSTVVGPRVHSGSVFDVYIVQAEGGRFAVKVPREFGGVPMCDELFGASSVVGGVSTLHDRWMCLGDLLHLAVQNPNSELQEAWRPGSRAARLDQFGLELLVSEPARVTAAGAAWNHRTLGIDRFELPDRGPTAGLVSPWIDGEALSLVPSRDLRVLVRSLPSLWDAPTAGAHGDVHAPNVVLAPSRDRFALIDPAAMVSAERGEDGASSAACWLTFTTHTRSYPVLPPYATTSIRPGMIDGGAC